MSVNRALGLCFGVVYVLVGVAGFVVTGLHGHYGFASSHGSHLLFFQVNPLHNVAHICLGLVLLTGVSSGEDLARSMNRVVGGVFLLLGILGPLMMGSNLNVLAMNNLDHVLHIATALFMLAVSVLLGRPRPVRAPAHSARG